MDFKDSVYVTKQFIYQIMLFNCDTVFLQLRTARVSSSLWFSQSECDGPFEWDCCCQCSAVRVARVRM
jgi:hypothetical protein